MTVQQARRRIDANPRPGQIVSVASLVTVSTQQPSAGISVAFDVEVTFTRRTGALSGRDTERVASFLRRLPHAKYFEILAEGRVFSKCRFSEPGRPSKLAFVHDGVSSLEELNGSPSPEQATAAFAEEQRCAVPSSRERISERAVRAAEGCAAICRSP